MGADGIRSIFWLAGRNQCRRGEPHPWLRHVAQDPINGYNLIHLKWQRLKTLITRITFRRWPHCLSQQPHVVAGTMDTGRTIKYLNWPKAVTGRNTMG